MKPRVTIQTTLDGALEFYLNETGRDLLVSKLQALDVSNEHFHFGPIGSGTDLEVQTRPYSDDSDAIEWGKFLFRTDDWDKEHFPHVLDPD